jgi:DNA-binding response OmpR family regulator
MSVTPVKKPRILVVDDDPRYLELLEYTLEAEDFDVLTVQDPMLVQEIASTSQPDVIVTDVAMPQLDGYTMAVGLKADPNTADIPLIFVTARGQHAQRWQAMNAGAAEYLTKPFSIEELVTTIRTLIEVSVQRERPDVS